MRNRHLAMALAAILTLSLLTGCGSGEQTTASSAAPAAAAASAPETAATSGDTKAVGDLDTTTFDITDALNGSSMEEDVMYEGDFEEEPMEEILPEDECRTYTFSNDEEMWFCSVRMYTDGSFFGTYERFEMAEEGKSYVTIINLCEFDGTFTDITDETDGSRTMLLRTLVNQSGEEYEMDHILYRPLTLDDIPMKTGETYTLLTPAAAKKDLPAGLKEAAGEFWDESSETLGFYALFNQDGTRIFVDGSDAYYETLE